MNEADEADNTLFYQAISEHSGLQRDVCLTQDVYGPEQTQVDSTALKISENLDSLYVPLYQTLPHNSLTAFEGIEAAPQISTALQATPIYFPVAENIDSPELFLDPLALGAPPQQDVPMLNGSGILPLEAESDDEVTSETSFNFNLALRKLNPIHSTFKSSLKPDPSLPVNQAIHTRCIKCWGVRQACKKSTSDTEYSRCTRCVQLDIPAEICTSERITYFKPFEKWSNAVYEGLFTAVELVESAQTIQVYLRHYLNGPDLEVTCCPFVTNQHFQFHALKKDSLGWHSIKTTSYCLPHVIDISQYVKQCIPCVLKEACQSQSLVAPMFQLASSHVQNLLVQDCLELFTALRLMRVGWQFASNETLGMARVDDQRSAWYGSIPVPRMISNQLNHLLELRMIELDSMVLVRLHELLYNRRKHTSWVVSTIAVFLLLHVRELDGGRNIYWKRYKDSGGFWIHPSRPASLLDEAATSCNSLLWHYHYSATRKPLSINWDTDTSQKTVDNDQIQVQSMRWIQNYVRELKNKGLIGRKATEVYKDGNPGSVTLTISSLVFADMEKQKVSGFC